jgi:hypothetical protein
MERVGAPRVPSHVDYDRQTQLCDGLAEARSEAFSAKTNRPRPASLNLNLAASTSENQVVCRPGELFIEKEPLPSPVPSGLC